MFRVEITTPDALDHNRVVQGEHTTVITMPDIPVDEAYTTITGIHGYGGLVESHFSATPIKVRTSSVELTERLCRHWGLTPKAASSGRLMGTQMALLAAAGLWLASAARLLTNAGVDYQSGVMFNPASTGSGGYAPACYIGISSDTAPPAPTDLALPGEVMSGTLARAQATYAHTFGTTSTTLSRLYTSDQTILVAKTATFNEPSGGNPITEALFNEPAQLSSGSQINVVLNMNQG